MMEMTVMDYMKIQNDIFDEYNKYSVAPTVANRASAVIGSNIIIFPISKRENPDENSIFDLLHEIGHLETNSASMKTVDKEFLATVWAIEKIKEYNIKLSKERKELWQNYIYSFIDQEDKNEYQLVWT